ncbi:MAG: ribosome recycling factor [Planctomycetota bacterium]|jgi:ribosome recycling factor
MPVKQVVSESKDKMNKTVEFLHEELKALRTGRASTGLVENIKVDYYGTATALKALASLSAPEVDMVVIRPFDLGSVKNIETAIRNSDLSIAPIVDGKLIRLKVPPLSEERRKQLAQQAKHVGEQAKVTVRNIRRDAIKHLEKEEKDNVLTEDDLKTGKKQIDDITKEYTDKIDTMVKAKCDEILIE